MAKAPEQLDIVSLINQKIAETDIPLTTLYRIRGSLSETEYGLVQEAYPTTAFILDESGTLEFEYTNGNKVIIR